MKMNRQRDSKAIRVLIVDDHPAVRQGLALLLEPEDITVCAGVDGHAEALAACRQQRPDVVLVDLSLGDEDGLTLLKDLNEEETASLVYSMYEDGRHVRKAFASGAQGYVTKREVHRVLVQAILEVAGGRRFVSPRAAIALAGQDAEDPEDMALSRQEQEVYRLLGNGESTRQIAAVMKISARTVESYYERIQVKLNLGGMQELRRHAINHRSTTS